MPDVTVDDLVPNPVFKEINRTVLEKLVSHCHCRDLQAGEKLSFEHNGRKYLYLIRTGYVTIRSPSRLLENREWDLFLAWRGPDDILGEMGIISSYETQTGTVRATDKCGFIAVSAKTFLREAQETPYLYRNIASQLVKKSVRERRRLEVIQMGGGVYYQVAKTLENLLDARHPNRDTGDAIEIDGTIRVLDIAGYIGVKGDAVGESLARLHEEKIIKREFRKDRATGKLTPRPTGKIIILDQERLRDACYRDW